jgi:hypothetical protein
MLLKPSGYGYSLLRSKKQPPRHNNDTCNEISEALKVVRNEKEGGSRRWQMIGIGLRPRLSRFVCLLILLSSLILYISVSAPVKQNE